MGTDSRWGKRFRTSLNVRFGLDELDNTGVVHDISVFGFFIMTSRIFPDGSIMKIQILTSERDHIHLEGIVQWSVRKRDDVKWLVKDNGMGIRIKRFHAGQEHYEKICHLLCQRKAMKNNNFEKSDSNSVSAGKTGILGRFFSS